MKFAAAVLLFALASGCTKIGSTGEGQRRNAFTQPHVLRYAAIGDVTTLNPMLSQELVQSFMGSMTAAWLCKYDRSNKPVPELATEIPSQRNGGVSADGKTITYHLRGGVRWSDGVPFGADDVTFSTKLVLNPHTNVTSRDGWDRIVSLGAPNQNTVVFRLREPYSPFVPTFFCSAGANPSILPKHLLEHTSDINKDPYNSKPVGIGPFRYVEWRRGDRVIMEANPYYFRGMPKLKRVEFKILPNRDTLVAAMQTGDVDMWPIAARAYYPRLQALPGFTVSRHVGLAYGHLDINQSHPVLSDVRVRHALVLAIDRRYLIAKVAHGIGILQDSAVSPASEFFDRAIATTRYDPVFARRLLDAAGWRLGRDGIRAKNGVKLNVFFVSNAGSPDTDTLIELIRGWWKNVGVELVRKNYDVALLFAQPANGGILATGKFDVAIFQTFPAPNGDLSAAFACAQAPPNGQNYVHYCNPVADAAMRDFKLTYDLNRQKRDSFVAQEQIARDYPLAITYISEDLFMYNADLKNFHPNAVTPFDDMLNVDI